MTQSRNDGFVGQITRFLNWGTVAGQEDGQILERFAIHGDGAAFEALVNRHGPTVLGVCRRFLRDPNDVDDAFQATFVILARKASGLRDPNALGPWLHGVAFKVASRARVESDRRNVRESPNLQAIALTHAPESGGSDLRWLLDEEILRLPDKLRLPVVLCLIEGKTYDEAALQLRWTAGMVRGRLSEARVRLRDRLTRRGVAPSVALAMCKLERLIVPQRLIDTASRITTEVITRQVGTCSALTLANRTMGSWLMTRIGKAALILIAVGVVLGIGSTGFKRLAGQHVEVKPALVQAKAKGPDEKQQVGAVKVQTKPRKRRQGSVESEIHPITIAGRAVDREGRAIAGAAIFVTNANRSRPSGDPAVLGRGVSGPDGKFILRDLPLPVLQPDPGPIPKAAEGKFEVAGTAAGFGFTWHADQSYRPSTKPADFKQTAPELVTFAGEPIISNLTFGPPARVHGRIIDDQGRPMSGAKVQFGYIDSLRNPDGSGMWNCSAINPAGGDELQFGGIVSLPESMRSTRTDADGRYSVDGLPREVKLITLIDRDPTLEPFEVMIGTSNLAFQGIRSLGHDGILNHTFVLPRKVPIRVTLADSGRPAVGVSLLAETQKLQRAGADASTDAAGLGTLLLQPGQYPIRIEPPIGMAYLPSTGGVIRVRDRDAEEPLHFQLSPAASVVLEAVDIDSKQALAGVGFESAADTSADHVALNSQPTFVDHPTTDNAGALKVIMEPGRRKFFPVRLPWGYEAVTKVSPILTLEPGKMATARFELKKTKTAETAKPADEDEVGLNLRSIWEVQARLIQKGRMQGTRTYQGGDSISTDRLRKLLESLDTDKVPPLSELIAATFPEAEPGSLGNFQIAVDRPRRRQEVVWANTAEKAAEVTVYNGRETISYVPVNAQVDIGDDGPKSGIRLAVAGLEDFCHWPTRGGKVIGRDKGKVTLESKSGEYVTTIVADEETGFVFHESRSHASSGSGQEYWQFAPRVAANGAITPGLSVDFTYQKDRLNVIWIKTIESIDLNAPVPPESFLIGAPPGTLIIDYREGRIDTQRGLAMRPITDVVAYADAHPKRFKPFVPPIKPTQAAPAISPRIWLDSKGETSAPGLAGQVVLIDFWGIGCGPCISQLPEVREAAAHFTSKGLIIIGLHDSSGTLKEVADFASKRNLSWPLAIDKSGDGFGATFEAYGVRSIPSAAVINRQGKLAFLGTFREGLAKAASLLDQK